VLMCCFSIALVLELICGLFFFVALGIHASHRPSDSIAPLLSRAGIRAIFFYMQYFIKSIGSVIKLIHHPFLTNMSHMCHACEM
jgi:hypothetical protein